MTVLSINLKKSLLISGGLKGELSIFKLNSAETSCVKHFQIHEKSVTRLEFVSEFEFISHGREIAISKWKLRYKNELPELYLQWSSNTNLSFEGADIYNCKLLDSNIETLKRCGFFRTQSDTYPHKSNIKQGTLKYNLSL